MHIDSRLPSIGTTIFTVMSQLAADHGALNLSQGFPDFSPPTELVTAVNRHMLAGRNQYAPMAGVLELRQAISAKVGDLYHAAADVEDDITVTSGATEALFCAITAVVQRGDEVIIFDPAYDSYLPAITLAGGIPVRLTLKAPAYTIDWQEVSDRITRDTRLIIINTPHNPTGAVFSKLDLDCLARITAGTSVLVLSDEVYEHIVFDGLTHHSVLSHPQLRRRSFAVSSFGKTYHMTGWKIAYCVAPPQLTKEFRKVHQYVTFCTNTPMQYAIADFMQSSSHHLELASFYQQKRDRFICAVADSRFTVRPCSGTYFQLLDYSAITSKRDVDYARELTTLAGIASIPISVFCEQDTNDKVLRFCFAKDEATLDQAGSILSAL